MRAKIIIPCLISVVAFIYTSTCIAENTKKDNVFQIVTDFTYKINAGDSREKYESLCLFGAKYKAVVLSAKYLTHKGVLENYGKKQKEIFCLTTNEVKASIVEKKLIENRRSYYIKIKSKVNITDFIKAEIKNLELEREEESFSWQEEMEQHVYKSINPAEELSRVYRYFRKRHWRIAIIYLDHLEKKYPNWQELYFAKAIGFYAMNNIKAMMDSLKISCSLGNREACEDVEGFRQHDKEIKTFGD